MQLDENGLGDLGGDEINLRLRRNGLVVGMEKDFDVVVRCAERETREEPGLQPSSRLSSKSAESDQQIDGT